MFLIAIRLQTSLAVIEMASFFCCHKWQKKI